jgi:hypothetical protein
MYYLILLSSWALFGDSTEIVIDAEEITLHSFVANYLVQDFVRDGWQPSRRPLVVIMANIDRSWKEELRPTIAASTNWYRRSSPSHRPRCAVKAIMTTAHDRGTTLAEAGILLRVHRLNHWPKHLDSSPLL